MSTARGWPADWDERLAGKDCPMCAEIGQGDSEYSAHVWDGAYTEVDLERRTSVRGYCVVKWSGRHVADPTDLTQTEAAAYWQEVLRVGRAVRAVFQPVKMNYLMLGNFVPHLHTHVVPRYPDDPAPGGPLSWELLVGAAPTPPEQLRSHAEQLRAELMRARD